MNVKPCPTCGHPSWNAALNPGQSCLPCERRATLTVPVSRPAPVHPTPEESK